MPSSGRQEPHPVSRPGATGLPRTAFAGSTSSGRSGATPGLMCRRSSLEDRRPSSTREPDRRSRRPRELAIGPRPRGDASCRGRRGVPGHRHRRRRGRLLRFLTDRLWNSGLGLLPRASARRPSTTISARVMSPARLARYSSEADRVASANRFRMEVRFWATAGCASGPLGIPLSRATVPFRWIDARYPSKRDLSLAMGYAGLDPMRVRQWPNEASIENLFASDRRLGQYLASRAGDMTLAEMVGMLGRRANPLPTSGTPGADPAAAPVGGPEAPSPDLRPRRRR